MADPLNDVYQELHELASGDPAEALRQAREILVHLDAEDRAKVELAEGLALRNLGQAHESVETLWRARAGAVAAGADDLTDEVDLTLAASLGFVGNFDEAIEVAGSVVARTSGLLRARAAHQQAGLLQREGRREEARVGYEMALGVFEQEEDYVWAGHLHMNLAILASYEGQPELALDGLDRAEAAYTTADHAAWVASARYNKGWVCACGGDLVTALDHFDEAEAQFAGLGISSVARIPTRADALLRAGLADRAYVELQEVIEPLRAQGLEAEAAEAITLASQAALRSNRPGIALELADEAEAILLSQGRAGWAALGTAAALDAGRPLISADDVLSLLRSLVAAGHDGAALRVGLSAADRLAIGGDADSAKAVMAALPPLTLTTEERVRHDVVAARLRANARDRAGALVRCMDAFTGLQTMMTMSGSVDIVTTFSPLLADTVAIARSCLDHGDVAAALQWSRRRRGWAADRWPVNLDPKVGRLLNQYRAIDAELREQPDDVALRDDLTAVHRALEETAWRTDQRRRALVDPEVGIEREDIGDRLDLAVHGQQIVVSAVVAGSVSQHAVDLDPALVNAVDRLHRLVVAGGDGLIDRYRQLLAAIDDQLFGQLELVGPAPLTVSLDPELRRLPVAALPSLIGRPLAVETGPTRAMIHSRQPSGAPRGLVIIDPDLAGARQERDHLHAAGWTEPETTDMARTLTDVGAASQLHVSCHGGAEFDNPMYSWLQLPAGRLYLRDLVHLPQAPEVVVLGVCLTADSRCVGTAATSSFAEGFLGAGTRWVIASSAVIPDDNGVPDLLIDLHDRMTDGGNPAQALAEAKKAAKKRGHWRAAETFSCYHAAVGTIG